MIAAELTGVADATPVRVDAELDGADVVRLAIDGTGLRVRDLPRATAAPSPAQVTGRTHAVIFALRVDAHPATLVGVPADIRVALADVPFAWVEGGDGSLAAELLEPSADAPVTGDVRVSVARADLVEGIRTQATALAAAQGVTLTRLDVDLVSRGPRALSVVADARLRKGLLSAPARLQATAVLDDDLVLTLRDVEVSSSNPLLATMLSVARGRLDDVARRRVDLGAQLPPGVRLSEVRLDVGETIVLTVRTS